MRILLLCLLLAVPAFAQSFRAGAAMSNITPPIGGNIVGGFHPAPSKHIHDELNARCLVLDDGKTKVAIVVLDLLGAAEKMYEEARRLVAAETDVPAANLFMSCTHTHSAQSALGPDRMARESDLDDYQRFVARRIADGVRRALTNLAPAQIGWAVGNEPREVFNRRWYLKPGTMPRNPFGDTTDLVKMNPGYANPNLDRPAGPVDPEVSMIAVRTPEGRPIALFASYSLHYVGGVRGGDISADYFALFADRMMQLLNAERQDPPFVAMLANGTSGDINNNDYSRKPTKKYEPYEKMREVAGHVAETAHKAYQTIQWKDTAPLAARLERIEVAIRRPPADKLTRGADLLSKKKIDVPASLDEIYSERIKRLNEWPATIQAPLQTLRVGDVAIGGIPNEVFAEIGLDFKKRSGFQPSFIVSNCGGYYGYLPTPAQHKLGGYETWLGTCRFEVDTSDKMLAKLLEMVKAMK